MYKHPHTRTKQRINLQDTLTAFSATPIAAGANDTGSRDPSKMARYTIKSFISYMHVKVQVAAQYGADSDQVASLGLKKKSERKSPGRAAKTA